MAVALEKTQRVLAYIARHMDANVSLRVLAAHAGLSRYQLHRVFLRAAGETPKQLTLRLRLGRAAVLLLTARISVLEVALSCGFQSHETFCRAFQRQFGMTPRAYRHRGFAQRVSASQAAKHAALVRQLAPCLRFYSMTQEQRLEEEDMIYSVTKKELSPQPVLVVRCKVKRSEIASTIARALPQIFAYAEHNGIALSGLPFTRYVEMGPGLITMEPGMKIAAPGPNPQVPPSGEGQVVSGVLPGGTAATTIHSGPYEGLPDAYAAVQQWLESQSLAVGDAPWECYLTDPAEYPNPAEWKTEVFWPLANSQ
jgi:AraC family transcriptional regulator